MRILSIIILISLSLYSFGQNLRFKALTSDQGLSQGTVWSIFQDSKGFVWVGTDDGLNRYDGYEIKVFKFNPNKPGTISDNSIYDIVEDKNGNIWLATRFGLNKYDVVKGVFEHYIKDTSNINCIVDNQIRCLSYDSTNHTLWIGSDLGNLVTFNLATGEKTSVKVPWGNEFNRNLSKIRSLFIDNKGVLWIGTNGLGLYSYNLTTKKFDHIYQDNPNEERRLLKNKITSITQDLNGNLLLGSDGAHVSIFNKNNKQIIDLGEGSSLKELKRGGTIRATIQEKNGTIWVASYDGLLKLSDSYQVIDKIQINEDDSYSLSSNRLLSLMIDKSGGLWIGNYEKGIDILNHTTPRFNFINKNDNSRLSINNNFALSFGEDSKNNLYIGTYEGLNYFDRSRNIISVIKNEQIKKGVLSICVSSGSSVWLGTWGTGLIEFNPLNGKILSYIKKENENSISNNTVTSVYQDPANADVLWVGTFDGLNKFNKATRKFSLITKEDGLLSNVIYHINGTKDTLWVGSKDGGLTQINPLTGNIQSFIRDKNNEHSISNNTVLQITNADSVLYIATKRGLNIFNKADQTFKSFHESDGLANSNIWAVIPDQMGKYWIPTNGGLSVYNPDVNNGTNRFSNFSVIDGIQGNEFNQGAYYYSTYHKEIFIGGINGVNYFKPDLIKESTFKPPINLTSLKIFNKEINLDTLIYLKNSILLPYAENFLSFEFASLDFGAPEKILYQFKMEGLDKNWSSPSTRRFASYPDLKPGFYSFKIKATNSQGIWSDKITSLKIAIKPPFWETYWFLSMVFLSIIIIIVTFIRWREKRLQNEKKILEETVTERTDELRKKNRDITSSIQYAKRIQEAIILPSIKEFSCNFNDSFVLFKPKDIVSGDFFWYTKIDQLNIFAIADCTGHGVPGAFMSIVGNNLLDKIVNEARITEPNLILDRLKGDLVKSLNQGEGGSSDTKDGMDIAIIAIEDHSRLVNFSGAYRPLIRISKGELIKYQADKISIGGVSKLDTKFTNQCIELLPGDCIYAFSDGYPDQFGGPSNKKFLMKRLTNALLQVTERSMIEQDMFLDEAIVQWMGNYSQIDDILMVGLRIN